MSRCIALILAGGAGNRMHLSVPKQFFEINGLSILQYTMQAFQRHKLIDAIYVVAESKWHETVREQAVEAGINKFCSTANAGATGTGSLMNGIAHIAEYEEDDAVVLVHDAVRPLLPIETINSNIAVCLSRGNAITAIESQESFIIMDQPEKDHAANYIRTAHDYLLRESVLRAQTPQTFRLKELKAIRKEATEQGMNDVQSLFILACHLGHTPLYAAQGSSLNFKLTHPTDIDLFRAIVHELPPGFREEL